MVITNLEHLAFLAPEKEVRNPAREAPGDVKGGIRRGAAIEARARSRAEGNLVAVTATAAVTAAFAFAP